jgi:hypothetical protein
MRRLLISYGPPHYGLGYALCQLLGGCAPWPGEKRWVLICFASVCVGYGLRRHLCCPQLGCGSGPSSDVGGWSPAAGATAEEVILPLRGGFTAVQRLPATAPPSVVGSGRGTFRVLSGGLLLCAQTHGGGSRLFHCSKGRRYIGIFVGCGLRLPARRRSRGIWLCNNGQCVA